MSQSQFVQPIGWRCPACGKAGDKGYCCDSITLDGGARYNHRTPVFSSDTSDEQLAIALGGGTSPRHLVVDRGEGVVRDAGPASKAGPRDFFGHWTSVPVPPGHAGRVIAYITRGSGPATKGE